MGNKLRSNMAPVKRARNESAAEQPQPAVAPAQRIPAPRTSTEPITVVCYGDSNTHGASGNLEGWPSRLPHAVRWTTQLQNRLGSNWVVIPEGLNGRTTVLDDEHCWTCCDGAPGGLNGRKTLLPILHSHKPVDVLILALGCNDLKLRFNLQPQEIANSVQLLLRDIKNSTCGQGNAAPKVVLMTPPAVQLRDNAISQRELGDFGQNRNERAMNTGRCLKELARLEGISIVDLTTLGGAQTGEDGLHFDTTASGVIAQVVQETLQAPALGFTVQQ